MKLRTSERIRIREYVRGIMAGLTYYDMEWEDGIDDLWMWYSHKRKLHLCKDDDDDWQCAVYNVRHGHVDVQDWIAIDLEGL